MKILPGVCMGLALSISARAEPTVLVSESFDYGAGSLAGKAGGTGWSSAWVNDYASGSSLGVNSTGMSYAGLATTGGSAVWASGGNGISQGSRTFSLVNSGIVYIQFLCQFGSTSGGGTPNLRLFHSGTLTGGLGGNGGTYGSKISILNESLNAASDGSSSSSANLSNLNLVVARIDYSSETTHLWVNPNLGTFDYDSPTLPDAMYAGFAPAFDQVAFYTRSPGQIDEFQILSVTVPEPATMSLLAWGAGFVFTRRRRHREVS